LDFDYEIKYRRAKENLAANALSIHSSCEVFVKVVSTISTNIMVKVKKSWETNNVILGIIRDLLKDPDSHPHYKWVNNHLNRKAKIVVGNDLKLSHKLIFMYHDIAMGGYYGLIITTKRIGSLFYWKMLHKQVR
jgi:hypothetical protein